MARASVVTLYSGNEDSSACTGVVGHIVMHEMQDGSPSPAITYSALAEVWWARPGTTAEFILHSNSVLLHQPGCRVCAPVMEGIAKDFSAGHCRNHNRQV